MCGFLLIVVFLSILVIMLTRDDTIRFIDIDDMNLDEEDEKLDGISKGSVHVVEQKLGVETKFCWSIPKLNCKLFSLMLSTFKCLLTTVHCFLCCSRENKDNLINI